MIGHELAVQQFRAAPAQRRDQPGQRHFRGIGNPAEHRFAAEHPIEPHAIKPADQIAVLPAFDRMGRALAVQFAIARLDPLADPGFARIGAGRGAGLHHGPEGPVAGYGKAPAPERPGERARTAESIKRQDRAPARLHPEDFRIVAGVGHREDPAAIGQHQHVGRNDRLGHWRVHELAIADRCDREEDKFLAICRSLL